MMYVRRDLTPLSQRLRFVYGLLQAVDSWGAVHDQPRAQIASLVALPAASFPIALPCYLPLHWYSLTYLLEWSSMLLKARPRRPWPCVLLLAVGQMVWHQPYCELSLQIFVT